MSPLNRRRSPPPGPGTCRWCYAVVTDAVRVAAALLATTIPRGRLASPFTARVYRNEWTGLTETRVVQGALEWLEELGWIRGGRPGAGRRTAQRAVPHINPRLRGGR